jgi:hypothetical protein
VLVGGQGVGKNIDHDAGAMNCRTGGASNHRGN